MFSLRRKQTRVCVRDFHDSWWNVSGTSCVTVFRYCYIEGERWRPRTCCTATIDQQRGKKEAYFWRADTAERYSPNILFSFVEFLSQIFSRGLTGDLNHGQLLAIASHVAGGLTHTVFVVFLYQKVCGWSESFKNNAITAREWNKSDTEALKFLPEITLHMTRKGGEKRKIAAIVHFPWRQVMTEKWRKSFVGFI